MSAGRRWRAGPEAGFPDPADGGPTAESRQSLWLLGGSPLIWAAHFMACYLTGAIWCAGAVAGRTLGPVRIAVIVYTAIALAGIAVIGVIGWRRHEYGSGTVPHDFDTRADRHRFLGFATLLLSSLSAVAVSFAGIVAIFFRTCR